MAVQIRLQSITCLEEVNEGSGAEEPYVLVTCADLHSARQGVPTVPNFEVFRYGVWDDFDAGETQTVAGPPIWGLSSVPQDVRDPREVALVVSLMENDNGTPEQYQSLLRAVAPLSLGASLGDSNPASRAARLTNAIRDALNGVDLPIPFALDDDHVGTAQLVLDGSDVAPFVQKDKALRIETGEGRYELVFRIKTFEGAPWDLLDNNPATTQIAAGAGNLYQLHSAGNIWRFTGTPMTGWQEIDNNPATLAIVADGADLYQLHNFGNIYCFSGIPMTGWQLLDNNPATKQIAASAGNLYQLHASGNIYRYTGTPMNGWQLIDNNPATVFILADGGQLYQLHNSGCIFRFTGTPMTGWELLDNNPATKQISAGAGQLYQRHATGHIFRLPAGANMSGWLPIDNNPATTSILADGDQLYQLHDTGRIYRFTGTPMTGWQLLDDNRATRTLAAGAGNLYQLHDSGAIWKARLADL